MYCLTPETYNDRASKKTSALRIIKPKKMKNDKGGRGDHKIRKMGRRCLWMASKGIFFSESANAFVISSNI